MISKNDDSKDEDLNKKKISFENSNNINEDVEFGRYVEKISTNNEHIDLINGFSIIFDKQIDKSEEEIKKMFYQTKSIEKIIKRFLSKLNLEIDDIVTDLMNKYIEKIYTSFYELNINLYKKGAEIYQSLDEHLGYYYELHYENIIFLMCCVIKFFTHLNIYLSFENNTNNLLFHIYGNEKIYDYLAENFGYELQLIPYAEIFDKFYKKVELIQINKYKKNSIKNEEIKQFEDLNFNHPELFPPYFKFINNKSTKYRRYEKNDNYHNCENRICNLCSKYRNIDKLRLINLSLEKIFDFNVLKELNIILYEFNIKNYNNYQNQIQNHKLFEKFFIYKKEFIKNINIIRNYYGEKISFYFLWMYIFIKWLIYPSIFGVIYFLFLLIIKNKVENKFIKNYLNVYDFLKIIFTIFTAIWGILLSKSWKQNERLFSYFWGTDEISKNEPDKENFKPDLQTKFVFGEKIKFSSMRIRNIKRIVSYLFLFLFILITTIGSCAILLYKQDYIDEHSDDDKIFKSFKSILSNKFFKKYNLINNSTIENKTIIYFYTIIFAAINAIFLKLLSFLFIFISKKLNTWENYQKQSESNKDLAIKLILFEFINNYSSCLIIGFLKPNIKRKNNDNYYCEGNDCTIELTAQLYTLYFIEFILVFIKTLLPIIIYYFKKIYIKKTKNNPSIHSILHQQLVVPADDIILEYNKILILFGYICLFSGITSLTPIIMMIVTYLYYKFDLFRFIKYSNINTVDKAKGIGIFNNIMKSFMFIGLNINMALILFLGKKKEDINKKNDWFYKLLIFFITENLILALIYLLNWYVLPGWFKYVERLKFLYKIKFFDREDENLPHCKYINIINIYENNLNINKNINNIVEEENDESNKNIIELSKNNI